MNKRAVVGALGICLGVAIIEGLLSADAFGSWYESLAKPSWHLPTAGFLVVAFLVYVLQGFIAYRFFAQDFDRRTRILGISALIAVMIFNALWNFALFETQDLRIGWLGLIAFLAPLGLLQLLLGLHDRRAALLNAIYVAWVLLYDVPLYYTMWKLNI